LPIMVRKIRCLLKKQMVHGESFIIPYALVEQAVSQIVIDDNNQKWIVLPKTMDWFVSTWPNDR
jgi:hypothetical protein